MKKDVYWYNAGYNKHYEYLNDFLRVTENSATLWKDEKKSRFLKVSEKRPFKYVEINLQKEFRN